MRVSQNRGYHFGGPNNKDYSILGSILGSPYFGKLIYNPFNIVVAMFFSIMPIQLQKDMVPEQTWKDMSANHVAAVQDRISSVGSLTAEEATEMVETVRLSHFVDTDKTRFCQAISQRLNEVQAFPREGRKETQVCHSFHNFLSQTDRRVLSDSCASQTTKLSQPLCPHRLDVPLCNPYITARI